MAIFIIGDLHLGFSTKKPMDVFGEKWLNHTRKIAHDWQKRVAGDDLVILAGDTSWAINFEQAHSDLDWIDRLPGQKLLLKGNHDYWWTTLNKMQGRYRSLNFLHNNAYVYGDYAIVGTRGWEVPNRHQADDNDAKIYRRECIRFDLSLRAAPADKSKIAVFHYPPFDEEGRSTALNQMVIAHGITCVYFGHIHSNYQAVKQGEHQGVNYQLISCDYLDFKLHQIIS